MSYLTGPFRQDLLALQPEIDEALEDYVAGEIGKRRDSPPRDELLRRTKIGTAIRTIVFLGNLRQRLGLAYGSLSAPEGLASDETMELLGEVFTVAKATVTSWGGRLYLVYLPQRELYTDPPMVDLAETNREMTLSLAGELGIQVIDIHSAIQSHDDPLSLFPFRRRGHFNEDGYRLIAESALEAISPHE
jgi:hypothetical protein